MLGTASPTRGWLLVEEPGPWGPGAVPFSRIGDAATAALRATAASLSSRLLLVRRPAEHHHRDPDDRTLFRVTCTRGREQVLVRRCAPDEVAAAAAEETGWERSDDPLLLVCTHGRKDWCCALRGRPTAAALSALEPDATWECSHLGGDRFAATVLHLPSGVTCGRVGVEDAAELVAALRAGRAPARLLRGRCCDALPVQAADAHARLALGRDALDDLRPTAARCDDEASQTWTVTLAGVSSGLVDVTVRRGHVQRVQRLTCGAAEEQHARTWDLVHLVVHPARLRG